MNCQELLPLLPIEEYGSDWEELGYQRLANHIRTCTTCSEGIVRLSKAVMKEEMLSCDACRARFPAYYEVTHPLSLSSPLSDVDVVEVALHLGSCVACSEQYHALVQLWNAEEQL